MLETLTNLLPLQLDYFLLLMLRVSALIFSSPIFGRRNIPPMVKIGFCPAFDLYPVRDIPAPNAAQLRRRCARIRVPVHQGTGVWPDSGVCHNRVFQSGFHVGDRSSTCIWALVWAGVMDVQNEIQVPMVGNLLNIILLIAFFGVNGHLQLIRMLAVTVEQIPLGHVVISPNIAFAATEVFALSFVLAVNVAMPVIAAALLGQAAMGILLRTVPQMNVFVVGIPLQIIIGLIILAIMMPVFVVFTGTIFTNMFAGIEQLFSGLIGAA